MTTICHKIFIMMHLLVYRLDYHETNVLVTLGYHKVIVLMLLFYQCMDHYINKVNKYEFLFHIIFSFLLCSVMNMCNLQCLHHIRRYCCRYWQIIYFVNSWRKLTVSINAGQYCKGISLPYDFLNIFSSSLLYHRNTVYNTNTKYVLVKSLCYQ